MSRGAAVAILLTLASVAGIGLTQSRLAAALHGVHTREDVFIIPPPRELRVLSLGYRAALADIVWVKLLLEYGGHWQEQRRFTEARRFADGIIELDARHRNIYRFIDAILVYQPGPGNHSYGTADDARAARAYLERGIEAFPGDHDLWLHYGQFVAFTGTAFLEGNPAEIEAWRKDGALAIAHAMELGARVDHTMAAPAILGRIGEREAAIRYLERAYAMADDEQQRRQIVLQLSRYRESAEQDAETSSVKRLDIMRRRSYPFLSRGEFLLLGPMPEPFACAGRDNQKPECQPTWARAFDGVNAR
jgi:tetratricopeptide (TPR) repeat protein